MASKVNSSSRYDPYWTAVKLMQEQLKGLLAGYNAAIRDQKYALTKGINPHASP